MWIISETPLWLLIHVAPIKSNNDAIVLILLLFKDITSLKQLIPEQNGGKGTKRTHPPTFGQYYKTNLRYVNVLNNSNNP